MSSPASINSENLQFNFGLDGIENDKPYIYPLPRFQTPGPILAQSSKEPEKEVDDEMDNDTLVEELDEVMKFSLHYKYSATESNVKPSHYSFMKDAETNQTVNSHFQWLKLYASVNCELEDIESSETHTQSELLGLQIEAEKL
uniref:Uncharacterized protein n=1 Tax=Moniliophthora roreri TaxID=221103 RepID=A0A0W0EVR1_MONRR